MKPMDHHIRDLAFWVLAGSLLLVAVPAAAQDDGTMTFGEEEAEEVQDGDGEDDEQSGDQGDDGGDDGAMTFGEDEDGTTQQEQVGTRVAVVAVPVEDLSSKQLDRLESRLDEALNIVREKRDDITIGGSDKTLAALKERTVATCVTEPLCLASVGRKAGVDRILLARAKTSDEGTWTLDLDYFDVENTLFAKYYAIENKSSFRGTLGELETGVREVFDIRSPREGPDYYGGSSSKALRIIGITSGVISVGTLVGGLVIGNQSVQLQNDLNGAARTEGGVYQDLSQQEALNTYDQAQQKALTANVLFGLSAGFAVTSGALILTNLPQGDDAEGRASWWQRLRISPRVGAGGAGVGASIDF